MGRKRKPPLTDDEWELFKMVEAIRNPRAWEFTQHMGKMGKMGGVAGFEPEEEWDRALRIMYGQPRKTPVDKP